MQIFNRWAIVFMAAMISWNTSPAVRGQELPLGSHPPALATPHFPSRMHAFVWRNWGLVQPERLAQVLQTERENVVQAAISMGLAAEPMIPPQSRQRGYITIIRRNWHLLPYDQLLELLDMTAEELFFILREDDFLFVKLGNLKPACERLVYHPPGNEEAEQAARIEQWVESHFGGDVGASGEPRFAFIERLSRLEGEAPPIRGDSKVDMDAPLRLVYSYFGSYGDPLLHPELDPYPDGLLQRLSEVGVNGVWLHVVLRDLAPGGEAFPEFGKDHEKRLATLKNLVDRAGRFGIGVYLYMNEPRSMPVGFFENRPELAGVREGDFMTLCSSQEPVRRWLVDSLAHVFTEVPDLAGIFTITASENLTNCWSHGGGAACPQCGKRTDAEVIAEVNRLIAEGVHRGNPRGRVIAWDWGWKGHGLSPDTIALLPKDVWLMSVSEWSKPIARGGVETLVGEYSLSVPGPGPRAIGQWQFAREQGITTAAKMQLNTTWELSSVPYLPALDLVAEHCENLREQQVTHRMFSWTVGGCPSPNLRVARAYSQADIPDREAILHDVALETFGPSGAEDARRAWRLLSEALREYPYHISVLYSGPQQMGPANLCYAEPTGFAATMVGIPYDNLDGWRGPYPREIFQQQFQKLAERWREGLIPLQKAAESAPAELREEALSQYRVARAAGLHFQSVADQTAFIIARDRLAAQPAPDAEARNRLIDEMIARLDREIDTAKQLYALSLEDSRLGFEASNHYFYVPVDLVEKIIDCEYLKLRLKEQR